MVIELLRDLGIIGIASTLIYFISKQVITQYFDKELKAFQSELEKEKIQFSKLHEERVQVMGELYTKLTEFDEDMKALVRPLRLESDKPRDDKLDTAAQSGEELRKFYNKNRFYFPPQVCDTMDELLDKYHNTFEDFAIRRIDTRDEYAGGAEDIVAWIENWQELSEDEIPEIRSELEEQFRELSGVETEENS